MALIDFFSFKESPIYGPSVRANFNALTCDEIDSIRKENFNFIAYGNSDEGKLAFAEVLTGEKSREETLNALQEMLEKRGHKLNS